MSTFMWSTPFLTTEVLSRSFMPFKRKSDKEAESNVKSNRARGLSIDAVSVGATLASTSSTLPFALHERGKKVHSNMGQAGSLDGVASASTASDESASGHSITTGSAFHPSLSRLAGYGFSASPSSETGSPTSPVRGRSNGPYPTPSLTPPTFGGQSSPQDDSQPSVTQRLEEAAKRARLTAARQALEATFAAEVHTASPLPVEPEPGPSNLPRDVQVDVIPVAEAQGGRDPADPMMAVLEEILQRISLQQANLPLPTGSESAPIPGASSTWDSPVNAEVPSSSSSAEPDTLAQPPPYQDSFLPNTTSSTQDELLALRLQLQQYKTQVELLTQEKADVLRQQNEQIATVLQQVKQSHAEAHKVDREERRHRELAQALAMANEKLKEDLDRQSHGMRTLKAANNRVEQEISVLRSRATSAEVANERLNREKANWQAQIDAMQHSLSEAERRVRCLDQVTRQRFEAKQGGYASVGRSALLHHSPHVKGPSMDIVGAVASFNDEVFQASTFLVENLEKVDPKEPAFVTAEVTTRARRVWGLKVVSMLEVQAKDGAAFNFLLLQNCLEVFITHWCMHIIEGWYPFQASFLDVLVELSAQTAGMTSAQKQQICGKQVKIISTESATPQFTTWIDEIIVDLSRILLVGGVKVLSGRSGILPSKLLPLIKIAYDLRLALAERDICGGLELAAPFPDLPFHPDFMQDAEEHALQGSRKKNHSINNDHNNNNTNNNNNNPGTEAFAPQFIAGTSALGLKRTLNGQPGVYEMVVKPRVALIRVFGDYPHMT